VYCHPPPQAMPAKKRQGLEAEDEAEAAAALDRMLAKMTLMQSQMQANRQAMSQLKAEFAEAKQVQVPPSTKPADPPIAPPVTPPELPGADPNSARAQARSFLHSTAGGAPGPPACSMAASFGRPRSRTGVTLAPLAPAEQRLPAADVAAKNFPASGNALRQTMPTFRKQPMEMGASKQFSKLDLAPSKPPPPAPSTDMALMSSQTVKFNSSKPSGMSVIMSKVDELFSKARDVADKLRGTRAVLKEIRQETEREQDAIRELAGVDLRDAAPQPPVTQESNTAAKAKKLDQMMKQSKPNMLRPSLFSSKGAKMKPVNSMVTVVIDPDHKQYEIEL